MFGRKDGTEAEYEEDEMDTTEKSIPGKTTVHFES